MGQDNLQNLETDLNFSFVLIFGHSVELTGFETFSEAAWKMKLAEINTNHLII